MDFKFVHLSDLHVSTPYSNFQKNNTTRHSLDQMKEIERIVQKQSKDLDLVIISGDISDSGDEQSLLLARQWIRNSVEIGEGAKTSLGLSEDTYHKLRIIPGNHDAYNHKNVKGEFQLLYQKSLNNYNRVFIEDKIEDSNERYEWLEKKERGVFIYYADTSFLGDPLLERDQPELKLFAKPAKGKFSIEKSELLLETFDKGMKGILFNPIDGIYIDRNKFMRSLKIIVMHHYLFEPPGYNKEPLLQMSDVNTVFGNIALADFDILLCGHKHISDFRDDRYINHFDKRAKTRYLMNYFRRILGIHSLPLTYKDKKGKFLDRLKSIFFSINFLHTIQKNKSNDKQNLDIEYLKNLNEVLINGIENPEKFDYYIKRFSLKDKLELIDEKELLSLAKTIRIDLKKDEKEKLKTMCDNLKKMINSLSDRQFLQIMAGSACKKINSSRNNSFNIYDIEILPDGYRLTSSKYDWSPDKKSFLNPMPKSYVFTDSNRPLHN